LFLVQNKQKFVSNGNILSQAILVAKNSFAWQEWRNLVRLMHQPAISQAVLPVGSVPEGMENRKYV
jgi:hypothetical protein